jgi:hypothetical protein
MENKYPKQLIERTKELYGKHSPSEFTDSDAIECIDNMSSLLNCLGGLYEKHTVKSDANNSKKNESID